MVSVNVAQLLLLGPGAVREFDFSEPLPDPADDVRLRGPISGHARLTRIPDGILVHSRHAASVELECARCLEEAAVEVEGEFDEEFLPSTDVRTGAPLVLPEEPELALIDEHNEIDLDEILRQNILTSLPLRPLCSAACPGLCPDCGQRLDSHHHTHPQPEEEPEVPVSPTSPFARLAVLFDDNNERS
jgi:DUF177 domain-containing protein